MAFEIKQPKQKAEKESYEIPSKEGTFEYYISGGEIKIIG